jgi:hypothetical protein
MQFYLMGALAFSAVVEPAVLYVAAYKLRDPQDGLAVVKTVLACFAVFDVFHALAAVAGSGFNAVLPVVGRGFDGFVAINFWVPLGWFLVRGLWFWGGECGKGEG